MKLKKLFKDLKNIQIKGAKDPEISGICSNSKLAAPGNLFIARKGLVSDGTQYIAEAIQAGAVAIVTDMYDPSLKNIVQVIHLNPSAIEGVLSAIYYKFPSDELFMVGITGTNGKTTTSFLVKYLLDNLAEKQKNHTGLIGTIEYIIGQQRYQAIRTTPDVISNQKMLREMCKQGCTAAVMEVTSHALDQGRVSHVYYDAAIFTNLTIDHLDYHETMDAYCNAKNTLFRTLGNNSSEKQKKKSPVAVVNADSPWLEKIIEGCKTKILTYAIENSADLKASEIKLTPSGTDFMLSYQGNCFSVSIPLVGRFNVYNCLGAIGAALVYGASLERIIDLLSRCPSVPGRLEPVSNVDNLKIYVDFAHTSDALENVLECLNELKTGKIITVFGCGGDRDKSKRPLMAAVAENYSDMSIVTSDNPRNEIPEAICNEIVRGFKDSMKYVVEIDRKKAILKAIEMANSEDIILIAGKGHEMCQIFAHKTIEFNDRKVAEELCKSRLKPVSIS